MTTPTKAALAAVLCALVVAPPTSYGQTPPAPLEAATAVVRDCSRWPASVFDDTALACVCPQGMWWNLRGDACLPREHSATEFCMTVWPGSQPFFVSGGGYRCVCAPPLLWDAQATGCRPPTTSGEEDCTKEWPGTLPVLSPSGTEFECRCPGGRRWDEASKACVPGAPVVVASRGFSNEGVVPAPRSAPSPYPVPAPADETVPPVGNASPAATAPPFGVTAPANGATAPPYGATVPPYGATAPADDAAATPGSRPTGAGGIPPVRARADTAVCDGLLSEIRGRAGAGQAAQADALGMRAAVAGCDPAAISEASRASRQ